MFPPLLKKAAGVICLFLGIAFLAACQPETASASADPIDRMQKWGQAEHRIMEQYAAGDQIYAQGKTIAISRRELEIIKARYEIDGEKDGEKAAYQYLVRREALLQLAIQNGYTVSEEDAREYVDAQKEAFATLEDPTYSAYLEGLEMSVSEYWESQYTILKNELLTSKYLEDRRQQYVKEHNFPNWTSDDRKKWERFLDGMARDYADNDNIKRIG